VAGDYIISLNASNEFGSGSTTQTIYVNVLTAISEISENDFSIYPNPTSGEINIVQNSTDAEYIEIFNTLGELIYQNNSVTKGTILIDLSHFEKGIYFIHIGSYDNSFAKRIILTE